MKLKTQAIMNLKMYFVLFSINTLGKCKNDQSLKIKKLWCNNNGFVTNYYGKELPKDQELKN